MQSVLNSLLLKCHQQPFIGEMLIHNFLINKNNLFLFQPNKPVGCPTKKLTKPNRQGKTRDFV